MVIRSLVLSLGVVACVPPDPSPSVFGPRPGGQVAPPAGDDQAAGAGEEPFGEEPYGEEPLGEEPFGEEGPGEGGAGPAVAPSVPSSFSMTVPSDWTKDSGWHIYTRQEQGWPGMKTWRTLIRVLPAIPAHGDFSAALRGAAQAYLPSELQSKVTRQTYRRYLGDRLAAEYVYAVGPEQNRKDDTWFTLYLVDCGDTWQPVEVASLYEYDGVSGPFNVGIRDAHVTAESVLSTIRCDGPRGADLFAPASFVKHWYFGSGAYADYVNIYTGSTTMAAVSYAGDYDLRADGTAVYKYSGATTVGGATQFGSQEGAGTWSFSGDTLTISIRGLSPRVYRVASLTHFPDATVTALLKPESAAAPTMVTNPDVVFTTTSQYAK